ncbi:MAG: hypothetical protein ACRD5M_05770 [Candidatus Acidiferrales bacterium]
MRRKPSLQATISTLFLASSSVFFAQQSPKQLCDVPLAVTHYVAVGASREVVRDLAPDDFLIRLGGAPATLESAAIDSGPKRLALILDASKNVPDDEWELQAQMAASLAERARPQDRLTLLLTDSGAAPEVF